MYEATDKTVELVQTMLDKYKEGTLLVGDVTKLKIHLRLDLGLELGCTVVEEEIVSPMAWYASQLADLFHNVAWCTNLLEHPLVISWPIFLERAGVSKEGA